MKAAGIPELSLRVYGQPSPETLEAVSRVLERLVKAVSEEAGAEAEWTAGPFRWECDGCFRERPEQHDDWVYAGGEDFCPYCALARATP